MSCDDAKLGDLYLDINPGGDLWIWRPSFGPPWDDGGMASGWSVVKPVHVRGVGGNATCGESMGRYDLEPGSVDSAKAMLRSDRARGIPSAWMTEICPRCLGREMEVER